MGKATKLVSFLALRLHWPWINNNALWRKRPTLSLIVKKREYKTVNVCERQGEGKTVMASWKECQRVRNKMAWESERDLVKLLHGLCDESLLSIRLTGTSHRVVDNETDFSFSFYQRLIGSPTPKNLKRGEMATRNVSHQILRKCDCRWEFSHRKTIISNRLEKKTRKGMYKRKGERTNAVGFTWCCRPGQRENQPRLSWKRNWKQANSKSLSTHTITESAKLTGLAMNWTISMKTIRSQTN